MDENIVTELRDWAHIIEGIKGKATMVMLSGELFTEAADEIERLRTEIAFLKNQQEKP